jgi:hypothetical protein
MVRYADDAVIGSGRAKEAEWIMKGESFTVCEIRLTDTSGKGKGSFTFLGFTHYWTKSKKGRWIVERKTNKKWLGRAITRWLRGNRHKLVEEQHEKLRVKLREHYHTTITFNCKSPERFFLRIGDMVQMAESSVRQEQSVLVQYRIYLKVHPLPQFKIEHS